MVVWEDGRMKKADYRKFIIKTVIGNDDFASMREVVTRRYSRLQEEKLPMPGLILIDGGLGQLHAAADALEAIGIIDQPLASIAKREEIIYVYGQEDEPVVLDRFSPILHLVQSIRDEAHRFAVTFHRNRRNARTLTSELDAIKGVGERTVEQTVKRIRQFRTGPFRAPDCISPWLRLRRLRAKSEPTTKRQWRSISLTVCPKTPAASKISLLTPNTISASLNPGCAWQFPPLASALKSFEYSFVARQIAERQHVSWSWSYSVRRFAAQRTIPDPFLNWLENPAPRRILEHLHLAPRRLLIRRFVCPHFKSARSPLGVRGRRDQLRGSRQTQRCSAWPPCAV